MRFLKAISILGFAAIIYTTFIISREYPNVTTTGKEEYFLWVSLFFTGISVAALRFLKSIKFTLPDACMMGLIAYTVINFVFSGSIAYSRLLLFLLLGILYFNSRIIISFYPGVIKSIVFFILVAGIAESIIGICQIYGLTVSNHSLFRATGTFYNPGPYGGYLAIVFAIALWVITSKYKASAQLFSRIYKIRQMPPDDIFSAVLFITAIIAVLTCIIVLPATMSRSAWMAVIAAAIYITAVNTDIFHKFIPAGRATGKRVALYAIILLVLITSGVGFYKLKQDSADGRALIWKITTHIIEKKPVTGVGLERFRTEYADAQAAYFEHNHDEKELYVAGNPESAFNEYLQLAAEGGLVGLIIFCIIIGYSLKDLIRKRSLLCGGMIALLVFALTSYPFHILPIVILLAIFTAAGNTNEDIKGTILSKIIFGLIICGSTAYFIIAIPVWNTRYQALREHKSIQAFYRLQLYDDILKDYSEVYLPLRDEESFLFEYGHSLNKSKHYEESNRILSQGIKLSNDPMFYNIMGNNYKNLGETDMAASYYNKAFNIVPNRVYPLYLLAVMYDELGDTVNAVNAGRRFLSVTPKVHSPATSDMANEVNEIISKYE